MRTSLPDGKDGGPPVKARGANQKKVGRPKGKPLSPKEMAQRQSAAIKTGEHSTRLLGKALPPCKKDVCPAETKGQGGFPCDVKVDIESQGGRLSVCARSLAEADAVANFKKAIAGDTDAIAELAALSLGSYAVLERQEQSKALDEGLTVDRPIVVGRDRFGLPEIETIQVENPRIDKLLKISTLLGHTADQQVITPKSRGEKKANEGIGKLGRAAWIAQMRRGLNQADELDS